MCANKVSTDRTDMDTTEGHRGAYPQQASRFDLATRECRLGLVNLSQDALGIPSSVGAKRRVLRAIKRVPVRRSSAATRLLTTLSAKSISRAAAERLRAATALTKVRNSFISSSMKTSGHFPLRGDFLHSNRDGLLN